VIAVAYADEGDLDRAISNMEKHVKAFKNDPQALLRLSMWYGRKGMTKEQNETGLSARAFMKEMNETLLSNALAAAFYGHDDLMMWDLKRAIEFGGDARPLLKQLDDGTKPQVRKLLDEVASRTK